MLIEVYTDGSATIATKPGGYGWVLVLDGDKHSEGNGHLEKATNNDAEMEAAIQGLVAALKLYLSRQLKDIDLRKPDEVVLCSDSQITLGWADGTYRFKQEAKYKKFELLKELVRRMKVKTRWVRGHSGDPNNERCDELANLGRHKLGPNDSVPGKPKKKIPKKGIDVPKSGILSVSFNGVIKIIDLNNNTCQDYDENTHDLPQG